MMFFMMFFKNLLALAVPITIGHGRRTIFAMFSDVAGFSQLPDAQYSKFLTDLSRIYLGLIRTSKCKPVHVVTWGDGLFAIFLDPIAAADFSLRLLRAMSLVDWAAYGLPSTSVRIGLHAGPASPMWDRLRNRLTWVGSTITKAARIEPVAAVSSAMASEEFAVYLNETPGHAFRCRYIGTKVLPKKAGPCRLYRLEYMNEPYPIVTT